MTHSLYFVVEFETWEKAREFRDGFKDFDDFIDLYVLKKDGNSYSQGGDTQPFLYFPVKDEKPYTLVIETGSHVAPYDTLCSLHWYYFTLAFLNYFKNDLEEYSSKQYYHLEGEDTPLSKEEMLEKIEKRD